MTMGLPTLIMAHGDQRRLGDLDHPKAFLRVGEETIIERTIRLAAPYGEVTIWAPLVEPWTRLPAQVWSVARPGASLLANLRLTYPLWQRGALILLGDVVYAQATIEQMQRPPAVRAPSSPTFFGRSERNPYTGKPYGEIYGLAMRGEVEASIVFHYGVQQLEGKLWDVIDNIQRSPQSATFQEITDFTDDIDTVEDVQTVLPVLHQLVIEEGLRQ